MTQNNNQKLPQWYKRALENSEYAVSSDGNIEISTNEDFYKEITCPRCECAFQLNEDGEHYTEDETMIQCDCGQEFAVFGNVEWTFSVLVDKDNLKEDDI